MPQCMRQRLHINVGNYATRLCHAAQPSELGWRHTSGSPLLGAGSNCKNFLFMVSFTSMIAAMFPAHPMRNEQKACVKTDGRWGPMKDSGGTVCAGDMTIGKQAWTVKV